MHLECLPSYSVFFLAVVNSVIHLDSLCSWEFLLGNSQKQSERT